MEPEFLAFIRKHAPHLYDEASRATILQETEQLKMLRGANDGWRRHSEQVDHHIMRIRDLLGAFKVLADEAYEKGKQATERGLDPKTCVGHNAEGEAFRKAYKMLHEVFVDDTEHVSSNWIQVRHNLWRLTFSETQAVFLADLGKHATVSPEPNDSTWGVKIHDCAESEFEPDFWHSFHRFNVPQRHLGLKAVSSVVTAKDLALDYLFNERVESVTDVLKELVDLKSQKDNHGKGGDYVPRKEKAWHDAREVLKSMGVS